MYTENSFPLVLLLYSFTLVIIIHTTHTHTHTRNSLTIVNFNTVYTVHSCIRCVLSYDKLHRVYLIQFNNLVITI